MAFVYCKRLCAVADNTQEIWYINYISLFLVSYFILDFLYLTFYDTSLHLLVLNTHTHNNIYLLRCGKMVTYVWNPCTTSKHSSKNRTEEWWVDSNEIFPTGVSQASPLASVPQNDRSVSSMKGKAKVMCCFPCRMEKLLMAYGEKMH